MDISTLLSLNLYYVLYSARLGGTAPISEVTFKQAKYRNSPQAKPQTAKHRNNPRAKPQRRVCLNRSPNSKVSNKTSKVSNKTSKV